MINKRKRVPNPRYISNSASEVSEETSLSSENDDNKINENRNYISKDQFQSSKRKNFYLNQNLLNLPYQLIIMIAKVNYMKIMFFYVL